ncbi:Homocysteine S-methyltransferase 1-like protein [Drosera capensis]
MQEHTATTLVNDPLWSVVVDGGLATQLETHSVSINDPLWSALCLINDPHLIKKVHMEYLEAGADILVTLSYQSTSQILTALFGLRRRWSDFDEDFDEDFDSVWVMIEIKT